MTAIGVQSLAAAFIVLALVAALAWLARRGAFATLRRAGAVSVETAVPLGERRSLVIVAVEGRRLLLGITPTQISMVTELGPTFDAQLGRSGLSLPRPTAEREGAPDMTTT
jgi:flagellar biosynthetic protein FliO